MDPDSGLLDKLLADKSLSKIDYDDVKDHHPFYRRNARLLDYISQKENYDNLIDALRDTRQTHLVNYLIENGGGTVITQTNCSYKNLLVDTCVLRSHQKSLGLCFSKVFR